MIAAGDTIAAVATAPGDGGVAVIRISGEDALSILNAAFRRRRGGAWQPMRLYYGHVLDADGAELDMGTCFDFMDEASHHDSPLVSRECTARRNLLRGIMEQAGFKPYQNEWWHYTLANEPFPDTYFDFPVE